MMITEIASSRSFGGWTKMFSHPSESCGGIMKCSIAAK